MAVLALPVHPQDASAASAMPTTPETSAAALVSAGTELRAEPNGNREPSRMTASFAVSNPAGATTQQGLVASAHDDIWGIPTPVFGAVTGALVGAGIGFGGTALLFKRGRRATLIDRAEDQQRQDAQEAQHRAEREEEQRRIDARDSWKDLHEDIKAATSGMLALCDDVSMRPLCEGDAEAPQPAALLRRLRLAIKQARGHRSNELTESLTSLRSCLETLEAALLPERKSLTDPSETGQIDVMHIAARSAHQARIAIELEGHVLAARRVTDIEWGSHPPESKTVSYVVSHR
ncbi:hypothetical protein ACFXAW_30245 [Streptomyces sp. NPDC059445]|uniref:hypothetical protein n=1 Tax=Streptomyces sp. NPDC059445 TaxID=3346832 RepID=UPI003693D66B